MASEPLHIESQAGTRSGQSVIRLTGSLNLTTEPRLLEQVRAETTPAVILDLGRVHYCDSCGVAALVQISNTFDHENRRLALVAVTPRIERALEITKVRPLFRIFATLEEAEAALA